MARFTILAPGDPGNPGSNQYIRDELNTIGAELKIRPYSTIEEMLDAARDVDGFTQGGLTYPREVVAQLPERIRVVGAGGIGVDFIDVDAATERGIIVYNIQGVFEREVAQHAMMLLLALARRLMIINRSLIEGTPITRGTIQPLYEQTLGLVSFGNIGRTMAKIAAGFDLRVIACDPFVSQADADPWGVTMVDQETLFKESDFVSCHVPLTPKTYHIIGERDFRNMKPSAYFINTGRGKVVVEKALIRALQEGWIAGAGLDVLEQEPPAPDNPLRKMENVVLTPHYASASERGGVERFKKAGRQLVTILSGRWPDDGLVNPAVKKHAAEKWGMPSD